MSPAGDIFPADLRGESLRHMLAVVHFLPLLKTLAPGFLPLFVYIGAEALFGETVGLVVGVAMGAAEFIYILIKDRKPDPFVAADTILLALLGVLSLCLRSPILFRLKPAIMEGLLAIAMGALLLAPDRILKGWLDSQLKGLSPGDEAMPAMRRSVLMMLIILALHAGICTWAAFALSAAAWGFVSGGLLYLMIGGAIAAQWIKSRRARHAGKAGPIEGVGSAGKTGFFDRTGLKAVSVSSGQDGPSVEGGNPFRWSLHITDGSGGLYAVRTGPGGTSLWDAPGRGRLASADIREAAGNVLASLGIDPALAGAVPGDPIQIGIAGRIAERTVFVATIRPAAFPKGVDPMNRRFWRMTDLLALRGTGKLDPDFETEITALASGFSDPALYRDESSPL
ncbi:MAG: hypothetical protein WAZ99_06130 [Rectinemataceae bacterium]